MRFPVDTNILARLNEPESPLCSTCNRVLVEILKRGDTLVGCAQVMIEFWAVATRPKSSNGLSFTPSKAETAVRDAEQMITFLSEPSDILARWRALANSHSVSGKMAHDTRLVALMEAHRIEDLLTLNGQDFARFKQIVCHSPETFQIVSAEKPTNGES